MEYYLTRRDDTKEYITPLSWDADPEICLDHGKWIADRRKYSKHRHVFSCPIFVDTETSKHCTFDADGNLVVSDGWVHQWAAEWAGHYIIGRTARQLVAFYNAANQAAKDKGKNWQILSYIHNMGYDMEYMRDFFPDSEPEFFAVKPHRILTARWQHVEIRCSYLLTGKALAKWSQDSGTKYKKLSGTYDYDRVILPDDPLTAEDWAYQLNDVACMADAWYNDRLHDGYNALTVPLTSTGFVREKFRQASQTDRWWSRKLADMQPSYEVYAALERAFAGGYTHGNRFFANITVKGPIGHRDFRSSYPTRQAMDGFPMGKFLPCVVRNTADVLAYAKSQCLLMHLVIKNPRLKDKTCSAPYLSASKCRPLAGQKVQTITDNGRILGASGTFEMWVTEYDYIIIARQYSAQIQIVKSYASQKGRLPKWFRDLLMEYYRVKTTMKGVDPVNYMISKAHLNGLYGMTAQKYVRAVLEYVEGEWTERQPTEEESRELYQEATDKRTTFLPYAWGVWTTAHARYALFECIEQGCGYARFLYADTDSIFYLLSDDVERAYNDYNDRIIKKAVAAGAYVEYKGKTVALGEFTVEDDAPIQEFRFIHSKCYALIDSTGKLKVTIAGVTGLYREDKGKDPKDPDPAKRPRTSATELGCIDNLKPGRVFDHCGGTRIVYNNVPIHTITVKGRPVECGASAIILPTKYMVNGPDYLEESIESQLEILLSGAKSDIYGDFAGLK